MSSKNNPSFWTTIPGIITGIAAVIGSITGLLIAIEHIYPSTNLPTPHSINDTIKQTSKSPTNLAPIANSGLNQSLIEGTRNIVLNGSESIDQDGDKLTYLWKQISGEPVYLKDIDKPISIFDSPNVTKDTQLIFRLTVDDNRSLQDTSIVGVKILNNENNDALLFKEKGLQLNNLGRYNESLQYFKQAFNIYQKRLEMYPSNAQVWAEAGNFFMTLGNHTDAMKYYNKALTIDPNNIGALIGKGSSLTYYGNYTDAITLFNKALTIDPNNDVVLNNEGMIYNGLGNYTDAITLFNKALTIDPNYKEALNNEGNAYKGLGNYKEAIKYYNKVLELEPNLTYTLYNKGRTLDAMGNHTEAKKYYNKALTIDPNLTYTFRGNSSAQQFKFREPS